MGRDRIVPLALGLAAVVLASVAGADAGLLRSIVEPPIVLRAALVGGSVVLGLWLLSTALERIRRAGPGAPDLDPRSAAGLDRGGAARLADGLDVALMLRGIRLVFLALAAFAAGAGWLLGHPLPLVLAAVIAGVDVIETSFLLLVLAVRVPARRR
jgi:hypothetical protein